MKHKARTDVPPRTDGDGRRIITSSHHHIIMLMDAGWICLQEMVLELIYVGQQRVTNTSTRVNEGHCLCSIRFRLQLTGTYLLIARRVGSVIDVIYSSNN